MTDARRVTAPLTALLLLVSALTVLGPAAPAAAAVPTGFSELTTFRGLVNPTAVRFAPDGRIFVAEKRGTIQMFDGLADPTPTQVADLRTEVYNFWDRGLSGLAVDPGFPARPYLYAAYTFDGVIGGTAPRWGTAGADSDPCPSPPGATTNGCVASGKLVRLTLNADGTTTKRDLIHDWCQQFPSHSIDDIMFGRDGALYLSAGESANFNTVDYGQFGNPVNPCGDPPGAPMTAPTAEGGALRSQDLRTAGDPVTLDGTVIRVSPDSGLALPDNPNAAAADPNARRIVAYGLRNPFRITQRPGTDELWIGDVGQNTWEEIDRLTSPIAAVHDFGWPCYEGNGRQSAYDAANLRVCEDLYAQGAADAPFFSYRHGQALSTSDTCATATGSSLSGLSFQFYSGGPYPPQYDGALFFADYSRNCIWVMTRGTGGVPERASVTSFVAPAAAPVDLQLSPAGELFYADFTGGTIRRIVWTGTAPATCSAGLYRAEYFPNTTLSGAPASTACEAAPLAHDWALGSPAGVGPDNFSARWAGTFAFSAGAYTFTAVADDGIRVWVDGTPLIDEWRNQTATTFTAARTLTAGSHEVRIEWYDASGAAVAKLDWAADGGNAPPVPQIATPAVGTTWRVGDQIAFSGSASDPEDGPLPASALSWEMVLQHCPSACHTHPLQSWTGVSSGSIAAPDHEYPSYLELRLTATDSAGRSSTVTRRLDPRTVALTIDSRPRGLSSSLGSRTAVTPFTATVIVGSTTTLAAATPQTLNGGTYRFSSWSDGGAQTHTVVAGATATYTAVYSLASCVAGRYRADYFAGNRTLSGTPVLSRCELAPLNRAWGTGGPGSGVGTDNFSARWSGTFTFPGGSRTFTATSDDGVRVWLDGALIIDHWGGPGTSTATRTVPQGAHTVRVQYYEATGSASVKVTW